MQTACDDNIHEDHTHWLLTKQVGEASNDEACRKQLSGPHKVSQDMLRLLQYIMMCNEADNLYLAQQDTSQDINHVTATTTNYNKDDTLKPI